MTSRKKPGFLASLFGKRPPRQMKIVSQPIPEDDVTEEDLEDEDIEEIYDYQVNSRFLTYAEHSFCLVARHVLGEQYIICPQVSLSAVFTVPFGKGYQAAFSRIARKRIDFIVCDMTTMELLFGIELDDVSHMRAARVTRDEFVNRVFMKAGLPLIRVPVKEGYNTQELKAVFAKVLNLTSQAERTETETEPEEYPFMRDVGVREVVTKPVEKPVEVKPAVSHEFCPNCGSPLKIKNSISGPNAGKPFYVCSRYPECKTYFKVDS